MKSITHRNTIGCIAAVLIILLFSAFYASPARAESVSENFVIKFDPVFYNKSQVEPGEAFQANLTGHAECNKSLPLPVSEATIKMQVVANKIAGGAEIILNPEFAISVKPFPDKQGETYDINESIPLQFPTDTAQGEYRITGKFLEARGKVIIIWRDFSGYLPGEQGMGTMKCVLPGTRIPTPLSGNVSGTSQPAPSSTQAHSTTTTITQPQTPTTSLLLPPAPSKEGLKSFFSWWMVLVIVVAVVALFLIFIYGFRRRE